MKTALRIGWILLCLALALAARCWNLHDVFVEGRIYFVDADCYSRMTRARMVAEHPGLIIRHHDFENWPQGITTHTTAPLDYLIVGLKGVLDVGFRVFSAGQTSVLSSQTLDLAGALISPLLGVAGVLFLALWGWWFRVRFWEIVLLFSAICPVLVHGTLLGRPDHQSLLIFLLTVALGTELSLFARKHGSPSDEALHVGAGAKFLKRHGLELLNGTAWGLSLWVSLYEPLVMLGFVAAGWWLFRFRFRFCFRSSADSEVGPGFLSRHFRIVVILAIVVIGFAIDGWRLSVPDPALRGYFANWQHSIGELSHLDLGSPLLFSWLGWSVLAAPILLVLAARQDRRAALLLGLLIATLALTVWQIRWSYFLAVVFASSLPWQLAVLRRAWVAGLVFFIASWPIWQEWDRRLFPEGLNDERQTMQRAETVALRNAVTAAFAENPGPFLAPWWLSPTIAYWTGQSGVAGSSHESLPGIVETARFYLSEDPAAAATVLRRRPVRWVIADEPVREISTSAILLGITPPAEPLATVLADHPQDAPEFLDEWKAPTSTRGVTFYRLYLVDSAKLLQ